MNQMVTRNHRWVSRLTRSATSDDRRYFQRYDGSGLIARIDTRLIEVDDVSVSGIRVAVADIPKGRPVVITLIPHEGSKLAMSEAVQASAVVAGVENGHTRLRFVQLQFSLAKLVIRHIAGRSGVQPFIFK